jgi:FixJ family two-component response regulator
MTDDRAGREQWKQVALEIGEQVRNWVNSPAMIGGDQETGYILMFFNMRHHDGHATLVSSAESAEDVEKILRTTLGDIKGKIEIVDPGAAH